MPRTPTPTSSVSVLMYRKEEEEIDDDYEQELFIQCIAGEVISGDVAMSSLY